MQALAVMEEKERLLLEDIFWMKRCVKGKGIMQMGLGREMGSKEGLGSDKAKGQATSQLGLGRVSDPRAERGRSRVAV